MKNIGVILSLCITMLFSANLQGGKLQSKSTTKLSYYKASGNTPIILEGDTSSLFSKLPFTKSKRKNLNGVYPSLSNAGFILEKGSYLISFTGTFSIASNPDGGPSAGELNLALQVGNEFFDINRNIIDVDDNIQTLTTYQLFHFDKRTKISIIAKDVTFLTTVTALRRSISIIKVG